MKFTARERINDKTYKWPWFRLCDFLIIYSLQTIQTPQHLRDALLKGLRLDLRRVLVSSRADLLANFLSLTLCSSHQTRPPPRSQTRWFLPRRIRIQGIINISKRYFQLECYCFSSRLIWMLPMHLCVSSEQKSATILICNAHILRGRQDSLCIKCSTIIQSTYRHKPDLISRT